MPGFQQFAERFIHLQGQRISFAGRPYLPPIYEAASRGNLVLRCSRQVEKSTLLANLITYLAVQSPGIRVLFVCPREEQALTFSRDRLAPTILRSPLITRQLLPNTTKMPAKNAVFANHSQVHIRSAFRSADASRGISADVLLIDEYQDIAGGYLPVLQETLSHSTRRQIVLTGTPKWSTIIWSLRSGGRRHASGRSPVTVAVRPSGPMSGS
ncbi:MAG TPA: phage terminase large subunit family protein [Planctomycetaceae bacterium]|nr:phage terminase large subunit family protein [Planctomycetaceae bacterium]